MMLMPANNTCGLVHYFCGRYPGKVGLLFSPAGYRIPPHYMPYAIDNGCFTGWDEDKFFLMLKKVRLLRKKPIWVCVPDAVADAETTFRRWEKYHKKVLGLGFELAFVAQDGMTEKDVPKIAKCVFVGGSTEWKLGNAHRFKLPGKLLHIGRVNTKRRLNWAERIGADSIDGTGWFRSRQQRQWFIEYFEGSNQLEMF